jgi:hypothetical protein
VDPSWSSLQTSTGCQIRVTGCLGNIRPWPQIISLTGGPWPGLGFLSSANGYGNMDQLSRLPGGCMNIITVRKDCAPADSMGALFVSICLIVGARHPMLTRRIHPLWALHGGAQASKRCKYIFRFYLTIIPICRGPRNRRATTKRARTMPDANHQFTQCDVMWDLISIFPNGVHKANINGRPLIHQTCSYSRSCITVVL